MLGPLALLLVLYFAYAVVRGSPRPVRENAEAARALDALVPALLMIGLRVHVALGAATSSEAAGLAALGAVLAAVARRRMSWSALDAAIRRTALVSAMIFFIFVGASVFSLVFRLLGGQAMISAAAAALGSRGALSLITAMIFVFVLGFFLDWLEIVVIALPALASALVAAGVGAQFGSAQLAACWLGALFAVNLQTSFLTPPFGYALFLVHGATGGPVPITQVRRRAPGAHGRRGRRRAGAVLRLAGPAGFRRRGRDPHGPRRQRSPLPGDPEESRTLCRLCGAADGGPGSRGAGARALREQARLQGRDDPRAHARQLSRRAQILDDLRARAGARRADLSAPDAAAPGRREGLLRGLRGAGARRLGLRGGHQLPFPAHRLRGGARCLSAAANDRRPS